MSASPRLSDDHIWCYEESTDDEDENDPDSKKNEEEEEGRKKHVQGLETYLSNLQQQLHEQEDVVRELKASATRWEQERVALRESRKEDAAKMSDLERARDELVATTTKLRSQVAELTRDRRRAMQQYARLRMTMQVMVRVRPVLLPREEGMAAVGFGLDGDGRVRVLSSSPSVSSPSPSPCASTKRKQRQEPVVDHLFPAGTEDSSVFVEVEDLLYMALDGTADVCILVYGQTGSGKSHTMRYMVEAGVEKIWHGWPSEDGRVGGDEREGQEEDGPVVAARYIECYQNNP